MNHDGEFGRSTVTSALIDASAGENSDTTASGTVAVVEGTRPAQERTEEEAVKVYLLVEQAFTKPYMLTSP